ncbi:MAG TPA: NADH-quinone oxidoreductase subunit J [Nevskiaceae bacterium]|nr:NADH-quinone oxidoreductase subunit J [Nevskiaceae bacterium]
MEQFLAYFFNPFYWAAFIAVFSTVMVISSANPVHALLYLVLSLLSVAMIFFTLGAPFAGLLEVIVYAGAIMVLFIFVVMMLNLGSKVTEQERRWMNLRAWIGPMILSAVLLAELLYMLPSNGLHMAGLQEVGAPRVGIALYGPYLLAVEFGSMLLLGALVAAYHLGKHD